MIFNLLTNDLLSYKILAERPLYFLDETKILNGAFK